MNEVTRIHLGRTAFTVSVDAHAELKAYLQAIAKHVGAKHEDVLKEVELRMAELLSEKGIKSENDVITKEEVVYLKEQLGRPRDFTDADDETSAEAETEQRPRRLFRDPRHQIFGGVASGLGAYFGVDPLIPRLIFILLILAGASGVFLYILLWICIPKAKTNSDILAMEGRPVTIESLKEFASNNGQVLTRAGHMGRTIGAGLEPTLRRIVQVLCVIAGSATALVAIVSALWTLIAGSYVLLNPDKIIDAGRIFPVGTQEVILVMLVMAVLVSLCGIIFGIGVSLARRKWSLPLWACIPLIAFVLIGSAVSTVLGLSAGPRVQRRYEAAHHTQVQRTDDFTSLEISGGNAEVRYEPSSDYRVDIRGVGDLTLPADTFKVTNGVMHLNVRDVRAQHRCDWLCIRSEDVSFVVHAPQLANIAVRDGATLTLAKPLSQKDLTIATDRSAHLRLNYLAAERTTIRSDELRDTSSLELHGIYDNAAATDSIRNSDQGAFSISRTADFMLASSRACSTNEPLAYLDAMPVRLTVAGQTFSTTAALRQAQDAGTPKPANCVVVRQ